MKKIIFFTLALFGLSLFSSCTSAMLVNMLGPQTGYGFYSNFSNPQYGYEGFAWGTSLESIKEKTHWKISGKNGKYFIGTYTKGWGANYHEEYWPHGGKDLYVDKTTLHFREEGFYDKGKYNRTLSMLYAAEDEYKKTPSLEFLHKRYGKFSEENVAKLYQKSEEIKIAYRSHKYLNVGNFYDMEILIYYDGKTTVKMCDPFMKKTISERNPLNNWICYAALDSSSYSAIDYSSNKRINFTFLNQNKDGKYLFVGYSKGYESSNISYIRSGICWGDNASGYYDIKGDSSVFSKKFSTEKWRCFYNNEKYAYTNIVGESARDILSMFLRSEKIIVRHNNIVSEFNCNGEKLMEKFSEYGIDWKEIDAALLNEEF